MIETRGNRVEINEPVRLVASVCLLLAALSGCTENDSSPTLEVQISKVLRIGGESIEDEGFSDEISFGGIADIQGDRDGNLYVLDWALWRIKKYSPVGDELQTIQLTEGEGPGELLDPQNIAVDDNGNVYVGSWDGFDVTEYDSTGTFTNQFDIRFNPTQVAVNNSDVLVASFWGSADSILHVFSPEGQKIRSFLARPDDWMAKMSVAFFGKMAVSLDERLFYSFPRPYRIIEINDSGQIIKESSGQPEFGGREPIAIRKSGRIDSHPRGLVVLPNGYILSAVWDREEYHVDIFSSDLKFLKRIPITPFGLEDIFHITSDGLDYLYLDFKNESPGILKFKVEINEN